METFMLDLPKNMMVASFELMNGHYITFEEYVGMEVEGAFLEWVDGKVVGFTPSNIFHQRTGSFLEVLMSFHAEKKDLGEIIRGDFSMKLEELKRGREPDILFVAKERKDLIRKNYLDGAADIAVEIVSPESIERDRQTKFAEDEAAGIREYWLIDPEQKQTEFYRLSESGFYQLIATPDGIFHSAVLPGFFLNVEWLRQNPPPTFAALKELNLV